MDRVSPTVRSRIMAAVKPTGTRTEKRLARILWQNNIRGYRKHWHVPGKPDFAWPGIKVAVFVDGCFWHGCPRCKRISASNRVFWEQKIRRNRYRDKQISTLLRRDGWRILRIWECTVSSPRTLQRIVSTLRHRRAERKKHTHEVCEN